jgi:hypothetical protein
MYGHHEPRNSTDLGPEIRPPSPVHPDLLYRLPPSYRIIPILLPILLISPRGRIPPLLDLRCRVGAHTGDGGVGLLGGIRVPLRLLLGYGRRVSGGRVGRVREVVGGVRLTLLVCVCRGKFVVGVRSEEVIWYWSVVIGDCTKATFTFVQIDSNAIQRPNIRFIHPV